MNLAILCLLFFFVQNCVALKKYTNYTLYRSVPITDKQLEFLKKLKSQYKVDFWKEPGVVNKSVDFLVAPESKPVFLRDAEKNQVDLTTIIEDVQKDFDRQTVATYIRRRLTSFDWQNYYRLEDIYGWLRDLAAAHPHEMTIKTIGKTFENRELLIVTINLKGSQKRSTVFVEGGIHAREWISSAFVTYFIHQIINSASSKDPLLKQIGATYKFVFMPFSNPDGYEYTHTSDRLWRKNRNNGYGVDINRNFGIAFGTEGVSFVKNEEIYCGPKAFSERESKALASEIKAHSKNLEYYLAFHSYGQYLILPYAHLKTHEDNFEEVAEICRKAKSRISKRYGTQYTVGTAFDTVGYTTSGVSGCWTKAAFHVPFVVTFELRDLGNHGFALPPKFILPTCRETMDGVLDILYPKTASMKKLNLLHTKSEVVIDKANCNAMSIFFVIFSVFLWKLF